jgi:hypothetical protein
MGSNPILAAIHQRKRRVCFGVAPRRPGRLLPRRLIALPRPRDQVRAGSGEPLSEWVHIDPESERPAIRMAELGGDIGGGHTSSGQERGGRVPERVHVHRLRPTGDRSGEGSPSRALQLTAAWRRVSSVASGLPGHGGHLPLHHLESDAAEVGAIHREDPLVTSGLLDNQAVDVEHHHQVGAVPGPHSGWPPLLELALDRFRQDRVAVRIDQIHDDAVALVGGSPRNVEGGRDAQVRVQRREVAGEQGVPAAAGDVQLPVAGLRVVGNQEGGQVHVVHGNLLETG